MDRFISLENIIIAAGVLVCLGLVVFGIYIIDRSNQRAAEHNKTCEALCSPYAVLGSTGKYIICNGEDGEAIVKIFEEKNEGE